MIHGLTHRRTGQPSGAANSTLAFKSMFTLNTPDGDPMRLDGVQRLRSLHQR